MTRTTFSNRTFLLLAAVAFVSLGAVACDGGRSPTEVTGLAPVTLSEATVSVDGQVVNGDTYVPHGQAQSTLFEARFRRQGAPATGLSVWVEGVRHDHGAAGRHDQAVHHPDGVPFRFHLFDDGTHGDPLAGDGIYCLEDAQGHYGFHHLDADHGEYHYDFWGEHFDGHHSNHMTIVVEVEG